MTDLVNLFKPAANQPVYQQGILASFNAATGANTVVINGAVFTNLPTLATSATITFTVGDVLLIGSLNNGYVILGRVANVGDAGYANGALAVQSLSVNNTNFALTTVGVAQCSIFFTPPAWASTVSIIAAGAASAKNSTGSTDVLQAFFNWTTFGGDSIGVISQALTLAIASVSTNGAKTYTGWAGATIEVDLLLRSEGAGWAANTANNAVMSATALYFGSI